MDSIRAIIEGHPLIAIGVLLVMGYVFGKASGFFRVPEITGFIVAGLLLGHGVFDVLPKPLEYAFLVLSQSALTLIAFTIGAEFYWPKLKRIGVQVSVMGLAQVLITFGMVAPVMYLLQFPWAFSLILGAIATATAPAATVAIVQSLRARGRYIDMLYGLVALDDAGAVIIFAIAFALAGSALAPDAAVSGSSLIAHALMELVVSVAGGAFLGVLIYRFCYRNPDANEVLIIGLGLLFLLAGLAQAHGYSLLLGSMAAGAAFVNCARGDQRVFRKLEPITPPLYALFFVIAGAELNPSILFQPASLVLGMGYVLVRGVAKYGSVLVSGYALRVEPRIRNYLGLSMLPQAGVALGLVLLVRSSALVASLEGAQLEYVDMMINVVLFSVLVSELFGPAISRFAIIRGNDMEEVWNS